MSVEFLENGESAKSLNCARLLPRNPPPPEDAEDADVSSTGSPGDADNTSANDPKEYNCWRMSEFLENGESANSHNCAR
jgi:hypothetical protein